MSHRSGPDRQPYRPRRRTAHTWQVSQPPPRRPGCPIVLAAPVAALIAGLVVMGAWT